MTNPTHHQPSVPILAIGAAAGGLAALTTFLQALPTPTNLAFVVLWHWPASRKKLPVDILQAQTRLQVVQAADGMVVQPEVVYVAPPGYNLALEGNVLCPLKPATAKGGRTSIDAFLQGLAASRGADAIAVILSGTGGDGAQGVQA
ncbi:MAG: hypothetical protein M3Q45_07530, partial [Chloroflexota bacterium]|nr:hypothetical protein [Chloroflexota bacterium]